MTKDAIIDPDGLSKGGGSLQKLGSELESGGGKLAQAGQRLAQHASQDKSGVGKVLMEVMGKGTQIAGDVIKEGGRVVKKSGQHLHESGKAHVENDHRSRQRFEKLHPDAKKAPHPKGGGSPPRTPPSPPGSGGGSGGGPHSPRNLGPSWHDDIKKHFTPEEQRDLKRAMRKLSEEPNDRGVPGSGRLTQHERELLARSQKFVTIDKDTPMQKVIPSDDVHKYLNGEYSQVGGFVARQQDAARLNTPDRVVNGMRLDYAGTPFHDGMPKVHAIEFPATNPDHYKTPLGAPAAADHGALSEHDRSGKPLIVDPSIRHASDRMHDAANSAGLNPGSYTRWDDKWPNTGAGVTGHPTLGIPERRMSTWMDIPDGSNMVEYDPTGTRVVTHTYDKRSGQWIPVSP